MGFKPGVGHIKQLICFRSVCDRRQGEIKQHHFKPVYSLIALGSMLRISVWVALNMHFALFKDFINNM